MSEHLFENDDPSYSLGVDRAVVYYRDATFEIWSGISTINEDVHGGDIITTHVDGQEIVERIALEEFGLTVEAFDYPEELESEVFDLTYRSFSGPNSYEIHLVYNCIAALGSTTDSTLFDSADPKMLNIQITTLPRTKREPMLRPSSHFILRSQYMHPHIWKEVEKILYGSDDSDPRLPDISDLIEEIESRTELRIIDHGDGRWSAIGPNEAIDTTSNTYFTISWASARYLNPETYKISSY